MRTTFAFYDFNNKNMHNTIGAQQSGTFKYKIMFYVTHEYSN